jgi:uncharacterized Zn finger protein (UPF0148 family)
MFPDIEPEHPRIRKYALDISRAAQSIYAKQQRIDLLQSRCKHPMNRLITKKQGLYCPVCGYNFKEVTPEVLAEATKIQLDSAAKIENHVIGSDPMG